MIRTILITVSALMLSGAAADAQMQETWEPSWEAQPENIGAYDPGVPTRPATGPSDRATLGNPARVIYGKEPTLGDSRDYRTTPPATCTGLLCN
jgi:hypothetical protein